MPYRDLPPTPSQGRPWLDWGIALDDNVRQAANDLPRLNEQAGTVAHTTSTTVRPDAQFVVFHTAEPPETIMQPTDTWAPTGH